ncbi:MAG: hypothetical protein K2J83_07540 [Clostridia bacterium]|nr:hypothetical protein [Clostridia bacterium]
MAKRKSNRGGYAAKTNKRPSAVGIIAALAILLAVVYVITSLAVGIRAGAPVWNPLNWGNAAPATSDGGDNSNDNDDNGDELTPGGNVLNVIESNGIMPLSEQIPVEDYAVYGISEETENAYLITMIIEPENAVDKRLIWSTSWQDSNSDWAQGKIASDYMSATPLTDYSNQATLTCKAAFGEPIEILVYSYNDSSINCTVQLDYVKHLKYVDIVVNPNLPDNTQRSLFVTPGSGMTALTPNGNINTLSVKPYFDIGTVEGNISNIKTTFTLSEALKTELNKQLKAGNGTSSYLCPDTVTYIGTSFQMPFASLVVGGGNSSGMEVILNNFFYQYGVSSSSPAGTGSGIATLETGATFTITYTYGDIFKQTYTRNDVVTGFRICNDGLTKAATVTSLTPDNDHFVFF